MRAGMVVHSADYPWSSYRANAQRESGTFVVPHEVFETLGPNALERQAVYRELFRNDLDPGLVDEIRRATNGNFALGTARFGAEIAAALGHRAMPGKPGRPRGPPQPEPDLLA